MTNRYHSLSDCCFGPTVRVWLARCVCVCVREIGSVMVGVTVLNLNTGFRDGGSGEAAPGASCCLTLSLAFSFAAVQLRVKWRLPVSCCSTLLQWVRWSWCGRIFLPVIWEGFVQMFVVTHSYTVLWKNSQSASYCEWLGPAHRSQFVFITLWQENTTFSAKVHMRDYLLSSFLSRFCSFKLLINNYWECLTLIVATLVKNITVYKES